VLGVGPTAGAREADLDRASAIMCLERTERPGSRRPRVDGPISDRAVPPAEYVEALALLHAGMRSVDARAPHLTERVGHAQRLLASHDLTPSLTNADRQILSDVLRDSSRVITDRGRVEQLLHGEPHPGNLLATEAAWSWPRSSCGSSHDHANAP